MNTSLPHVNAKIQTKQCKNDGLLDVGRAIDELPLFAFLSDDGAHGVDPGRSCASTSTTEGHDEASVS